MVLNKCSIKLAFLGCLLLMCGLASAADSNKDKLKQMLDGNSKPQASSGIPDDFLTGHWIGMYDYDNRTADTSPANTFTMVMEKTSQGVAGIILEPDLNPQFYAQIAEVINPKVNGKKFTFTKKYNSGTTIEYSLEADLPSRVLYGTWSIKNGPSGIVQMGKIEVKDFQ